MKKVKAIDSVGYGKDSTYKQKSQRDKRTFIEELRRAAKKEIEDVQEQKTTVRMDTVTISEEGRRYCERIKEEREGI